MYIHRLEETYGMDGDKPYRGYRYEVYPFLSEHATPMEIGAAGCIVVRVEDGKPAITCNISFMHVNLSIADTMQLLAGFTKAVELSQTAEFVRPKHHTEGVA